MCVCVYIYIYIHTHTYTHTHTHTLNFLFKKLFHMCCLYVAHPWSRLLRVSPNSNIFIMNFLFLILVNFSASKSSSPVEWNSWRTSGSSSSARLYASSGAVGKDKGITRRVAETWCTAGYCSWTGKNISLVFPKFLYEITAFSLVHPQNVGYTMQPSQFRIAPLPGIILTITVSHLV